MGKNIRSEFKIYNLCAYIFLSYDINCVHSFAQACARSQFSGWWVSCRNLHRLKQSTNIFVPNSVNFHFSVADLVVVLENRRDLCNGMKVTTFKHWGWARSYFRFSLILSVLVAQLFIPPTALQATHCIYFTYECMPWITSSLIRVEISLQQEISL